MVSQGTRLDPRKRRADIKTEEAQAVQVLFLLLFEMISHCMAVVGRPASIVEICFLLPSVQFKNVYYPQKKATDFKKESNPSSPLYIQLFILTKILSETLSSCFFY